MQIATQPMSSLRLFVAIELPQAVRDQLCSMQPQVPGVRPTKVDNLHLTLQFIGDASREQFETALEPISSSLGPFDLELAGVGRFATRGRDLILWAGVQRSSELLRLYSEIGRMLAQAGAAVETRPYHPHITIARGRGVRSSDVADFLERYRDYAATVRVRAVDLMSSVLQDEGSAYSLERRYPLLDASA